jgi:O-acetylserine/cysteine efflux transporter
MPARDLLLGVLVTFIWAANFVAVRLGLDAGLPPLLLTGLRFLAVAALVPAFPRPCGWGPLLGLGALFGLGQLGFSAVAMAAGLSPGIASLAAQTQAFFTMGLAAIVLRERPATRNVVGAATAGAGIALLAILRGQGATVPLAGLALILAAALSWAGGNLLFRHVGRDARPLAVAVWIAAIAAPPMLCLSWAWEGSPIAILSAVRWPVMAAGVVAFAAVCSTLAATGIWAWLLTRHSVGLVAPLSLLVPVFGMSLSAVLLGERFGAQDLLASAMVLLGLVISLGLVSGRKTSTRPRFVRNS